VQDKDGVKNIISQFNEYIRAEILADNIGFLANISNGITIDVNNDSLTVKVTKKEN
jgi:acetolactate synthase small subunit